MCENIESTYNEHFNCNFYRNFLMQSECNLFILQVDKLIFFMKFTNK